jgi:aerobic C4-dicarboxylate transport protein
MPAEDPIHGEDVAEIDDDLTEYGHHAPKHHATSADRRPAYSETI